MIAKNLNDFAEIRLLTVTLPSPFGRIARVLVSRDTSS
jgi:hypothetical protein